jgi:hypothetical protein
MTGVDASRSLGGSARRVEGVPVGGLTLLDLLALEGHADPRHDARRRAVGAEGVSDDATIAEHVARVGDEGS